jgi:hypothetical protein
MSHRMRRATFSLFAVVASLSACARPPQIQTQSAVTVSENRLSGQLTKPVEALSGEQFYAFTHSLRWGGGVERVRNCTGTPGCAGSPALRMTRVRVDAVDGQESVSAIFGPASGVVAIRAINTGAFEEARYGMKPDRNLEYYLIVLPGDARTGRWQLEELDVTPDARHHRTVSTGTFTPCNHAFQAGRAIRADFHRCDDGHMNEPPAIATLVSFGKSGTDCPRCRSAHEDPIWASCAQGCCIMN